MAREKKLLDGSTDRNRKRWLFRLGILLIGGLVLCLLATGNFLENRLIIANRSGQPIALLKVTISGETTVVRDVAANTEEAAAFKIKSDDHFELEGKLEDGTMFHGRYGTVANGMIGERVRLIILPGGQIVLEQNRRT